MLTHRPRNLFDLPGSCGLDIAVSPRPEPVTREDFWEQQ
jgi:hypothetical protein